MKNLIAIAGLSFAVLSCNHVQESASVASLSYNTTTQQSISTSSTQDRSSSVSLMETKVEAVAIQTADFEFKPKSESGKAWFNSQKPKIDSDTDELPDSITFD